MKFSDLKNPAAAADLLKKFKKSFSAKTCMSPTGGCGGGIIAAHTPSVEAMLRPISRDGHVYAAKSNPFDPTSPIKLGLLGLRDTSVFNGFCSIHNKELFSPIEDATFVCDPRQLFLHAFRAIAKESYLKRKMVESFPSIESIKEIHGIAESEDAMFHPDILLAIYSALRGAEELERTKSTFDKILLAGEFRRLVTTVIPFNAVPSVVCNFAFAPRDNFAGEYVQDYENWEADLSQLMVAIVPARSGGFSGFALLSYLSSSNLAPSKMIESLLAQDDLTSSLLRLMFCHAENFAISPDWYDSLTNNQKGEVNRMFLGNVDMSQDSIIRLCDTRLSVDSWQPGSPFSI